MGDQLALTLVGRLTASHLFQEAVGKGGRPPCTDGAAKTPIFGLSHGTLDMLLDAPVEGFLDTTGIFNGNANILVASYRASNDVNIVGGILAAFSDHGCIIYQVRFIVKS